MAVHRATFISRDVRAGCFVCHGTDAHWFGGQAQGTAARHHDATKHSTWCDVAMSVRYGETAADDRQIDLEDSIAAAGSAGSSGGEPDAAPLPVSDASAVLPAGVSKPEGRPVGTPRHAGRGSRPQAGAPHVT